MTFLALSESLGKLLKTGLSHKLWQSFPLHPPPREAANFAPRQICSNLLNCLSQTVQESCFRLVCDHWGSGPREQMCQASSPGRSEGVHKTWDPRWDPCGILVGSTPEIVGSALQTYRKYRGIRLVYLPLL